jgi:DNA polymerase-3 subunit gamma/tau
MDPHVDPAQYVVVARRYRPQRFEELVGQEHVARALIGAIGSSRVGHAYLFTGARGVGKTSAARILAKALNCVSGPTAQPCNTCDICRAVSSGEDVDVVEIDGASNRGIDEIRQLRQNVGVRPSRARFKIYIIDEVHMLTREAFNALLKTLEEPPEHVKFIFCTTEPEKVPVTVLSRCQRFDFAGIRPQDIARRLAQITQAEGVQAEPAALELLARRAGGSMRDSQSLLEQLLAMGGEQLRLADVHALLGTAAEGRIAQLLHHIVQRDPGGALQQLDATLAEGVDVGQLLEQLLGYLRDVLVVAAGAPSELLLYASGTEAEQVAQLARRLSIDALLAMMQAIDHTLGRMRVSTHRRTLAELCLVRLCRLGDLQPIEQLLDRLRAPDAASSTPAVPHEPSPGAAPRPTPPRSTHRAPTPPGKNPTASASPAGQAGPVHEGGDSPAGGVAGPSPTAHSNSDDLVAPQPAQHRTSIAEENPGELTESALQVAWQKCLAKLGPVLASHAERSHRIAILAPNRLVVQFGAKYSFSKEHCQRTEHARRLQDALAEVLGRTVHVDFAIDPQGPSEPGSAAGSAAAERPAPPARPRSQRELWAQAAHNPLVQRSMDLFRAQPLRIEPPAPNDDEPPA